MNSTAVINPCVRVNGSLSDVQLLERDQKGFNWIVAVGTVSGSRETLDVSSVPLSSMPNPEKGNNGHM